MNAEWKCIYAGVAVGCTLWAVVCVGAGADDERTARPGAEPPPPPPPALVRIQALQGNQAAFLARCRRLFFRVLNTRSKSTEEIP